MLEASQETAWSHFSAVDAGKRIREQRMRLGYTQAQLAEMMNLSNNSSISQVENGWAQFSWDQLLHLANVLQTTTDYILSGRKNNRVTLQVTFENADVVAGILSGASIGSKQLKTLLTRSEE